MYRSFNLLRVIAISILLSSCAVVREGEVGVVRTLGKYRDTPLTQGVKVFNPLTSTVVKVSTQTENMEVELNLPSKEGLNIRAEISILYHLEGKLAPDVLRRIGPDFERAVILPVFRSAVADVSARYFAKDMHTGQRAIIEEAIKEQMETNLEGRGISIETVLVKSIQLPNNLARAIEEKLEAEQQSFRMEFILSQARQQAEQRRIEAEGIRDAQLIIAEGLTPAVLRYKSIEAFLQLAQSPNAKIIVSDGDLPVMITEEGNLTAASR
ncbi:regulator of protease activity HflC (stomatin/prohibitin superfamily) [Neolewinella xylanilytica]|uniref:Regulator of protease activity HflC (Stomatin/prohibitin superfamily) n=1 Tax=Neolewinella xylanilytica TaxID=1514080 RepID=A0A2S6IBQ0_9BACT|nr:prohibitin family protein [Neolewinella xylanilytica]PPK88915.1 regulator of protease activity HflC (stomatin/prohibitin superfamily) [Neolewinella xylanilytica]